MWWSRRSRQQEPVQLSPYKYGRRWLYADTVEGSGTVVDRKDNGRVYEVHWVKSEAVALEYLRHRDVRQEGYYVIVETPGRDLGRDMIMIFDEADGSLIEIPERTPLPELQPSTTRCARCGYPVLPAQAMNDEPVGPPGSIVVVQFPQSPEEVVQKGMGYRCTSCRSAACAACYQATNENTDDGTLVHSCWVCNSPVTSLTE
jgi:hypothetical protein